LQHFRKKRKEQESKTTNVEGCLFVERSEEEESPLKDQGGSQEVLVGHKRRRTEVEQDDGQAHSDDDTGNRKRPRRTTHKLPKSYTEFPSDDEDRSQSRRNTN
jgi:hypothetical protein